MELRYSVRCHTAWARMFNYRKYVPYDAHLSHGWIKRTTDGKSFRCTPPAGTNQYCVTKMVYDKSPRTAYARGWIDDHPNSYDQLRARTKAYWGRFASCGSGWMGG